MNARLKRRLVNLTVPVGLVGLMSLGFSLTGGIAGAQTADQNGNVVLAEGPVIPQPCTDCDNHNQRPGNGPGIFQASHACDVSTGQGIGIYFLGNPNSQPVTYDFASLSGGNLVEHEYTGVIPAGAGTGSKPTVNLQVADVDHNGMIHLQGELAGRHLDQVFSCPCLQPVATTTTALPPASSTPGGSTSSVPLTGSSSPGVTSQMVGRLPETGSSTETVAFVALVVLASGALLVYASRKFRAEP